MNVVLLHALPLDERMWEPQREALEDDEVTTPNLYRLGRRVDEWAARVLGMVEGYATACVGSEWISVVAFVVLVAVLMFRPTGILGEQVGA